MSEKKNWGSTVLGWFVVRPEDEGAAASDPAAADAAVTLDPTARLAAYGDGLTEADPVEGRVALQVGQGNDRLLAAPL